MVGKYFHEAEWECHCGCGQNEVHQELVDMMDALRAHVGKPVIVHCVNRCVRHNHNVGGHPNSYHIEGKACDFHVKGMSNRELHRICLELYDANEIITGGWGQYSWGAHIDIANKRYWRGY